MKNSIFSGWKDVLLFTVRQGVGKKYKMTTLIIALVLFAGGFAINIFQAQSQQKDVNISPVQKVYVIDESGLEEINWKDSKQLDREQFPEVSFEPTSLSVSELGSDLQNEETIGVIAQITKEKSAYEIRVYIPNDSRVTVSDGENLADAIESIVHEGLVAGSGIDADIISYIESDINTEFSVAGEKAKGDNLFMLTTVFPIVFMFGLYFMVIIYGQSMGQIVSVEKSSKLMEFLLVMTKPYGLIFGKIIATAVIAIFQMGVWIAAGVGGFMMGDDFARSSVYSGYDNMILSIFQDIAKDESVKAFTTEAIVLAAVAVCLAFLFYCMLAGAIASFASKADELGSVMMFYNIFIILGFFGSYIIPSATGQEWLKVIIRLIPMSSAFLLPGELLIGTVKTGPGVIYLLILFVWIILTAVLAGKVYKDQVFYRGQSLKNRLPWMRNKGKEDEEDNGEEWQILHDEVGGQIEKSQRIGYFFLTASPVVIFLIIQIFASFVLTNIMTRVGLSGIDLKTWEVKDFVDYYHGIEPTLNPLTLLVCHLLIITIFATWLFFIRRGKDSKHILHIKEVLGKQKFYLWGACLVFGVGLCLLANGMVAIENAVVPSIVEEYMKNANSTGFGKSPYAIIAAVCLAPIGEEFLCRGVCMHFGKKSFDKFWYANIFQALIFGILHLNWVQGVYAFFIGLVLGLLVEWYDSLLPAMLVHFIINFSSSTWMPRALEILRRNLFTGIMLVVVPGIIIIAVLKLTYNKMKKSDKDIIKGESLI